MGLTPWILGNGHDPGPFPHLGTRSPSAPDMTWGKTVASSVPCTRAGVGKGREPSSMHIRDEKPGGEQGSRRGGTPAPLPGWTREADHG